MDRYIGIDIHKDFCHATVQNQDGEIVKKGEFENSPSGYDEFFKGIGEASVAIEAGDAWQPVYDHLIEKGYDVVLANPYKLRIIAEVKIKTDVRDSEALADLIRADLVPEVYVPYEEMRELRRVVKRRAKLVMERSKFFSRIKAELRKKRIGSDVNLRTQKAKCWLKDLEIDSINDYLEVVTTLDKRIEKLQREIRKTAGEMEETKILMTIPYVSYFSALTIIAEIATIERFPTSSHLCSYAGLVPEVNQSGSKTVYGSIKGGRPVLRWILYQSAWNHVHHANSHLTRFYERLERHKPKKLATIATARKLTKVVYWMLKLGEEFHSEGYDPRGSR
ncbi:hypothetical protein AKJ65_00070 [candidate division MSBL1 archaeon SCGC-AAA259E19]|uniref:Uncharacterized protein n=1 Tax=candidate division MSBL1 archaeon SCGC-AAA259E19 TaxID=1698264 RepID=A0A133UP00_9EURY|nr:hypothetical protein AKJ65_00070 [candidate division MSBL1 archaeon SCGC-AAA259E19]